MTSSGPASESEPDEGELAPDEDGLPPIPDAPTGADESTDAADPNAVAAIDTPLSDQPVAVTVESRAHGWRLDHYLQRLFPNYSRELFKKAINQGAVLVNGLEVKPSRRLRVNDALAVRLPEQPDDSIEPEEIPLSILYEDDAFVVIDKQAGLIVHPGKGNYGGTLANALQFHFDTLSDVAGRHRPGIVHRLDRETSGVLVVAKDNQVHEKLSRQFEQRTVEKQYVAIVNGRVEFDSDWIETHVRVHRGKRERMEICEAGGNAREANTFYKVAERFRGYTLVDLFPKTGRTHQLRVHLEHLGHPIVADHLYGGGRRLRRSDLLPNEAERSAGDRRVLITRQALHAHRLTISHPVTGESMTFEAALPADMQRTLEALRELRR